MYHLHGDPAILLRIGHVSSQRNLASTYTQVLQKDNKRKETGKYGQVSITYNDDSFTPPQDPPTPDRSQRPEGTTPSRTEGRPPP